jgi:hypothetical protein
MIVFMTVFFRFSSDVSPAVWAAFLGGYFSYRCFMRFLILSVLPQLLSVASPFSTASSSCCNSVVYVINYEHELTKSSGSKASCRSATQCVRAAKATPRHPTLALAQCYAAYNAISAKATVVQPVVVRQSVNTESLVVLCNG